MQPKWFFTAHQVARLKTEMLKTGQKQLWLACQLQHYAMLRPTELGGLMISDLLLEENKILCRAEISKNKKREFIVLPKHISQAIAEVAAQKPDNDFLFCNQYDKQVAVNHFYNQFRKVLLALNMDAQKHSFYSWKHTGARAWVKSGGSVYGLMRHSLDQTQQYLRKLGILEFEDDVNAMPII